MNANDFKSWRERLGLTQEQAAEALGLSRPTIARYESDSDIPLTVELACQRLEDIWTINRIEKQAKKSGASPPQSILKELIEAKKRLT